MVSFASSFSTDSDAFAIFVDEKFHFEDRKKVISKEATMKINSFLRALKDKKGEISVTVKKAKGTKCSRCWKIVEKVEEGKCSRCSSIK